MNKLGLITCLLSFALISKAQTKNFIDQPYIEVSGSADTLVIPDQIFLKIILSERDSKDRISLEELELRMVDGLKKLFINVDENLATADMASNFKFYLLKSKDVIKTKEYVLKVTDALTVSQVFKKMEDLGISNTSIERIDHSNIESLKNKMRENAIENAKARSIALTKPLGQQVGLAIHIADVENYSQQLQGRVSGIQIQGYSSMSNADLKQMPNIDFEKIKVCANINVKFVLK